jgi:hypothetical protein
MDNTGGFTGFNTSEEKEVYLKQENLKTGV